jgi:hypothetical protein
MRQLLQERSHSKHASHTFNILLAANMVNFRDPAVIAQDLGAYTLACSTGYELHKNPPLTEVTTKLWHMMSGIYL